MVHKTLFLPTYYLAHFTTIIYLKYTTDVKCLESLHNSSRTLTSQALTWKVTEYTSTHCENITFVTLYLCFVAVGGAELT